MTCYEILGSSKLDGDLLTLLSSDPGIARIVRASNSIDIFYDPKRCLEIPYRFKIFPPWILFRVSHLLVTIATTHKAELKQAFLLVLSSTGIKKNSRCLISQLEAEINYLVFEFGSRGSTIPQQKP